MAFKLDTVEQVCADVAAEVQAVYNNLTLYFIVHGRSQLAERMALSEHEIIRHPAAANASTILKKAIGQERSSFLGMAVARDRGFLGLMAQDHVLALFNLNTSEFTDILDIKTYLYHLAWHAIDLMEIRQKPEYKKKFAAGPMIPKRSPLNLAKANLQADVFASIMSALHGEPESLTRLAQRRADYPLLTLSTVKAEDYPFIVAMEATQFAFGRLNRASLSPARFIPVARQISLEVGFTFDDASIRQWWSFAEPAQDMAWRGLSREQILGASVFTCEDPYVRATGYLITEVLGISPTPAFDMGHIYNPFLDSARNKILHQELVERAFEDAIEIGLETESGLPLLNAANMQNEHLTEGKILGWCAHALQAAARAFEQALVTGSSPHQAARQEFDGAKSNVGWDTLKDMGDAIISRRRMGQALTLGSIAEICNENPLFAPVLGSIKITMNDPAYLRKLEAANDLALRGPALGPALGPATPAPAAPGPKGPAPTAPAMAPVMPAPAPGLGGNRAAHLLRQRLLQQRQVQKETEDVNGDGSDSRT